jgi:3-phosphoshikimate 1-carboxyvinyltransferase
VVVEPEETRNHTELMLIDAGADLSVDGLTVSLREGSLKKLAARKWTVPGDISSAAFWIVCAAAREGAELLVRNCGLNPRRTALLAVLERMGADIEVSVSDPDAAEPFGDIRVRGARLKATEIGGAEIPNLVDEVPVLAVAAALAEGRTVVRDARELRVKESDRLAAISQCLGAAGAEISETHDGLIVEGNGAIDGGCQVESRGDHRIAMAMAVAGLCARKPIEVSDVDCILTSYPSFWDDLNRVAGGCCA